MANKIYKLTCDDPELIYYGSTIHSLNKRLINHKYGYKNKKTCSSKILFDVGNVKIHLIEEVEGTREDLIAREK